MKNIPHKLYIHSTFLSFTSSVYMQCRHFKRLTACSRSPIWSMSTKWLWKGLRAFLWLTNVRIWRSYLHFAKGVIISFCSPCYFLEDKEKERNKSSKEVQKWPGEKVLFVLWDPHLFYSPIWYNDYTNWPGCLRHVYRYLQCESKGWGEQLWKERSNRNAENIFKKCPD